MVIDKKQYSDEARRLLSDLGNFYNGIKKKLTKEELDDMKEMNDRLTRLTIYVLSKEPLLEEITPLEEIIGSKSYLLVKALSGE